MCVCVYIYIYIYIYIYERVSTICTREYVSLLQSFHRGALSIYWYIAQTF